MSRVLGPGDDEFMLRRPGGGLKTGQVDAGPESGCLDVYCVQPRAASGRVTFYHPSRNVNDFQPAAFGWESDVENPAHGVEENRQRGAGATNSRARRSGPSQDVFDISAPPRNSRPGTLWPKPRPKETVFTVRDKAATEKAVPGPRYVSRR